MYLHFLGTGDAFGSGGQFHTSFYLKTTKFSALIDCGATTTVAMKRNNLSTDDIDIIFISHFHGDHFGGLPYFVLEAAKVAKRKKPLTIVSPPGCKERLKSLLDILYKGSSAFDEVVINFLEFNGKDRVVTDFYTLDTFPATHTSESLPHALRITAEGKTVAFSGDTSFSNVLSEVSHETDLFICECNFYKHESSNHLNYFTLLEKAGNLKCKKLLITHLGEEMLKHEGELKFERAKEGDKVYL